MREFLRDEPSDAMAAEVEALSADLERAGDSERVLILGRRGDLLRVLGRTDDAIVDLEAAMKLALSSWDLDTAVRIGIRLGTARYYRGEHERGERDLRQAKRGADAMGDPILAGFACQHLGKCLAEQGRDDEARTCFETALGLRTAMGATALANSSREALDRLEDV